MTTSTRRSRAASARARLDSSHGPVAAAARKNPATEVQLRADKNVPYGRVAELIGMVQKAGLSRIGFIAEPGAAPAR